MRREKTWNWIKHKAEVSFVPCVAVAATVISIVLAIYYLIAFMLVFGVYFAVVILVALVLALGGRVRRWVRR